MLSDKLSDLLLSNDSPVVGPVSAKQLAAYAAEPEPRLPQQSEVEVMIGKLTTNLASAKSSTAESVERLDGYWLVLSDIPINDLRKAYVELLKTQTFMPKPAEIRTAALKVGALRRYAKSRAKHLVWKHETEWRPPAEMVDPAEVKALLESAT